MKSEMRQLEEEDTFADAQQESSGQIVLLLRLWLPVIGVSLFVLLLLQGVALAMAALGMLF